MAAAALHRDHACGAQDAQRAFTGGHDELVLVTGTARRERRSHVQDVVRALLDHLRGDQGLLPNWVRIGPLMHRSNGTVLLGQLPGFLGETMTIFLAEGLTAGVSTPEEDEKIELRHTPLSELLKLIRTGKIKDGKTIVGTLLYADSRKQAKR